MKACDVMVSPVITVKPESTVQEVARIFLDRGISGAPVLDEGGTLVGMVTEGDLLHRSEAGTERQHSRWLQIFFDDEVLAAEYVKSHARKVKDVMTRDVLTAAPGTPLHEIATLLEAKGIKRVPIVANDRLVGIVSRSNLVQAVATGRKELEAPLSDTAIRDKLLADLKTQEWSHSSSLNVTVADGVVNLWGITNSGAERKAIRVAAEAIPGVRGVNDNMILRPTSIGM
jgi:CBS domain-containing protein